MDPKAIPDAATAFGNDKIPILIIYLQLGFYGLPAAIDVLIRTKILPFWEPA